MTDERKIFERWMRSRFPSADLTRGRDGEYIVGGVETRWQGWQARAMHRPDKVLPEEWPVWGVR